MIWLEWIKENFHLYKCLLVRMCVLVYVHVCVWCFNYRPQHELEVVVCINIVPLTVCRYRFPDMFPDSEHVRDMQRELDEIIQLGVANITRLVRAAETRTPGAIVTDSEEDFEIKRRQQKSVGFASEMINDGEDDSRVQKSPEPERSVSFTSDSAYDSRLSSSFLQAKNAMKKGHQGVKEVKIGQGRLASQLIRDGIITPEVLAKLQAEWQLTRDASSKRAGSEERSDTGSDTNGRPSKPVNRRGRR